MGGIWRYEQAVEAVRDRIKVCLYYGHGVHPDTEGALRLLDAFADRVRALTLAQVVTVQVFPQTRPEWSGYRYRCYQ